jgi:flagellar motor switch protein FliM
MRLGKARGAMNLCIPNHAIDLIESKLVSNNFVSDSRHPASDDSNRQIISRLNGAVVEVVVELAVSNFSTADLIALRVGDLITTEQDVRQPLTVSVDGHPKFHASPGAFKGHKAIQVIAPISESVSASYRSEPPA